jgi:hypothetical protein
MVHARRLALCIVVLAIGVRAYDFGTLLPLGGFVTRRASHVVNLNITTEVTVRRDGDGIARAWLDVTVPFIHQETSTYCPSMYLVDVADPLGVNDNLTFFIADDAMGRARSVCAAIDYTYNASTFATDAAGRYSSVRPGWNVSVDPQANTARYQTYEPLVLNTIVSSCGGFFSITPMRAFHGNSVERRYDFAVNVCQVGYYGLRCDGSDGTYASACAVSRVVVIESPMNMSSAASLPTEARVFDAEITFVGFNTTDAGGCEVGKARGMLVFELVVSDFDPLMDVRYMNPPDASLGALGTPTRDADGTYTYPEGDNLREGVYAYGGDATVARPGLTTWYLVVVTRFMAFDSPTTFAEYFKNTFIPGSSMTQVRFAATFQNGNYAMLNLFIDGSLLVDRTPTNGTCASKPLMVSESRAWPWAVPVGMTVTMFLGAGSTLFLPALIPI